MKIKQFLTLIFALSLFLAISINAQTQEEPLSSFKVGDVIYHGTTNNWSKARIEEFYKESGYWKVRYGSGKYDTTLIQPSGGRIIRSEKYHLEMQETDRISASFFHEAMPYVYSVDYLADVYDPKSYPNNHSSAFPVPPDPDHAKLRQQLVELEKICKKYPNIKNGTPPTSQKRIIDRAADICEVVVNREVLIKKAIQGQIVNNRNAVWDGIRNQADNNMGNGAIHYDLQLMALDFEGWKTAAEVKEKAEFAKYGAEMPPNFFERLRPISVEVKAFIDKQMQTNRWVAPKFQDAAAQSIAKRNATDDVFKRSTILTIGMDDAAWVRGSDSRNEVGRDSKYVYYKIEKSKNFYKIGRMLVKGPVAGYCQEREFIVKRTTKIELEILDGSGKFVKCP
ncbi:MAG: hypothetical protein K1X72_27195 [Pyrinomonadaceae bacterium]|nr:hypothetical protein [Pyrinomonadaceae bacterium]